MTSAKARPERPRDKALAPQLLARVFHQPALVYFIAVARHASIREAARQLDIASSAVTRQIALLEDALGMALFHRTRKSMRLTTAGEILFRHAQRLASPMDAAISELEMLRGLKTGVVRVAAVESVGLSFLPALLSEFSRRFPRLHLDISILSAESVIAEIAAERVEIGFGFLSGPPLGVEIVQRRDVRVGVVMRPDHPLAATEHIVIADCLTHGLAIPRPEISIRQVVMPFMQRAADLLPPVVEVNSIRMLVELALNGGHVSIMTPIGAQHEIAAGRLIFRPLEDKGLPTNRFGILIHPVNALYFAPAVFFEHAKAYFDTLDFPGSV
ncbi:MAG: LysR family transcriptional regulator [Alphaproteobacteria bacterium]|nr:LysR family transcriptional regulator [Alphaproteobacteria bacterium]